MSTARDALRNKAAEAQDIKKELVHSTFWDCDFEARGMSGEARATMMENGYDEKGKLVYRTWYPAVIAAGIYVPGTDELVFGPEDRDLLNSKSAAALEELAEPVLRLSGMSKDDLETAEKK